MNNLLLSDILFCNKIKEIITNEKQCEFLQTNKLLWWDNLKFKIKKYAAHYAKKKAMEKNKIYWNLQNQIERESRRAAQLKNYDVTKLQQLQTELKILEMEKCQGAILRSKAKWAFEGDRNTKFFINLEKIDNKIIPSNN